MPNKTVYVSPDNEPLWDAFKTQYSSVNSFLSSAYIPGVGAMTTVDDSSHVIRPDIVKGAADGTKVVKIEEESWAKNPSLRLPSVKASASASPAMSNPNCKVHGTPLDGRGKCLQKNCKYA